MKLPKKLKKIKNDFDFIDPETMKKSCSFNECCEKFELGTKELATFPEWRDKNRQIGIVFDNYYYVCKECGRTHGTKKTRWESASSYHDSIASGRKTSPDEWDGEIYNK